MVQEWSHDTTHDLTDWTHTFLGGLPFPDPHFPSLTGQKLYIWFETGSRQVSDMSFCHLEGIMEEFFNSMNYKMKSFFWKDTVSSKKKKQKSNWFKLNPEQTSPIWESHLYC